MHPCIRDRHRRSRQSVSLHLLIARFCVEAKAVQQKIFLQSKVFLMAKLGLVEK